MAVDGASWKLQATPPSNGLLTVVSCPAAKWCTAVGRVPHDAAADSQQTLAEGWDGTSWQLQSPPQWINAQDVAMDGVSCVSSSWCISVGFHEDFSGNYFTAAELWNGAGWTLQSTSDVSSGAGFTLDQLAGVSCSSQSSCIATGDFTTSANVRQPLAEQWDGTSWILQQPAIPSAQSSSELSGIACENPIACVAVGYQAGGSQSLVEIWDGATWTVQVTPGLAGAAESKLAGVSCSSSSACTAVGHDVLGSAPAAPLIERYF